MQLHAERSGRTISLGDRVQVQVTGASVHRRQIDLELLDWGDTAVVSRSERQGRARQPAPRRTRQLPRKGRGRRGRR